MGLLKALRRIDSLSGELHEEDHDVIAELTQDIRDCLNCKDFIGAREALEEIKGQVDSFDWWIAEIYPEEPDLTIECSERVPTAL